MRKKSGKLISSLLQVVVLLAFSGFLPAQAVTSAADFDAAQPTVLITGANRGIGLAFTRHYVAAGWNVIATARKPDQADELQAVAAGNPRLLIAQLDVTDLERIEALAAELDGVPIDVLINNAAVLGSLPGQLYGSLDFDQFEWTMAVNVYGPMAMAESFRDNVAASEQKKIVTLTSGLGSLTLMSKMPGMTYYRISKAGVNMAMRAIRANLRQEGIIVALIAPGMVQTQLLADSGYRGKALSPTDSVAGMAEIIAALTLDDPGTPTNVDGATIPW
jgi:NAD(P)-dependent dehydrogenase (short-subunit alcohol dehydrogenase family)